MNWRAYVAEFIGTFTLIFVGVCAIGMNSGLVGIALAHGLAIAVMVSATAAVSGGHLNPAVTFGALVTKHISPINAIGYVFSQCAGAVAAAVVCMMVLPGVFTNMHNPFTEPGMIANGTPAFLWANTFQAFVAEVVATFFLVFVVMGTGIDPRAPRVGGLFIGLTVAMDILAVGPISGAAMNPARHFGPAVVSLYGPHLAQFWLYWLAPLIGGAAGACMYHFVLGERVKVDRNP